MTIEIWTAPRTDRHRGPQWRVTVSNADGMPVLGASWWNCSLWDVIARAVHAVTPLHLEAARFS